MRYATLIFIAFTWGALWLPVSPVSSVNAEDSRVRLAHFSPDAGAVDVYINDERIIEQIQFGTVSDWFILPDTDGFNLRVTSEIDSPERGLAEIALTETGSKWTTVAFIGLNATDTLALQDVEEDRGEILPGEGRFAFFNAVQGVGPLDILLNDTVLFQLVRYPIINSTQEDDDGYVEVDVVASIYEVMIQENFSGVALLEPFELSILPDRGYLLALIGTADNVEFLIVSDPLIDVDEIVENVPETFTDDESYIRFGHLSSGTNDLDFYLDDMKLNSAPLSFPSIGVFMEITPGEYTLSVKVANQPQTGSLIPERQITIRGGSWTTVATIGLMDNDTLALQVLDEDYSDIVDGDVRLTIFHAVPGISALDITANGLPLISLLGYPGSQGDNDGLATVNLLAGIYDIQVVNSANEEDIFIDFGEINLTEGNHFMLALIRANPPFVFTFVPVE